MNPSTADQYRETIKLTSLMSKYLSSCQTSWAFDNCLFPSLTTQHFDIIYRLVPLPHQRGHPFPTARETMKTLNANRSRKNLHAKHWLCQSTQWLNFLPWPLALWTRPGLGSSWKLPSAGPFHWRWLLPTESRSGAKWPHPGRPRRCLGGCPCLRRFGRPGRNTTEEQRVKDFIHYNRNIYLTGLLLTWCVANLRLSLHMKCKKQIDIQNILKRKSAVCNE